MFDLQNCENIGSALSRPECVLVTRDGTIYSSDWRDNGGVAITSPNGQTRLVSAVDTEFQLRPNGIGLLPDGSFLLAHLGDTRGGLFRLTRDGECTTVLDQLDGINLPPSNYPHLDAFGRIWLTVSTRQVPRADAYRADIADGFIVLIDNGEARIVADGLCYTNECCVHPDGRRLFVNETFGRRLTAYDIGENGDLSNRQTITEFGAGTYPDGLTFDEQGAVWITSIVSNRIIRVLENGRQQILLEDVDAAHLADVEVAYHKGELGRPHLDNVQSRKLKNISSLAFGGSDRKTVFLGCLLGSEVVTYRSTVAGWAPPYWHFPIKD